MLLTPRAPSTAVEGTAWLYELFEKLVKVVGPGGRLGHFARPDVGRGLLQMVAGVVEQRSQGKNLCLCDPGVACLVEAARRIPDVGLDVAYVVDAVAEAH